MSSIGWMRGMQLIKVISALLNKRFIFLLLVLGPQVGPAQIIQNQRFSSMPEYTEEVRRKIDSIPEFKILPGSKSIDTCAIDNSLTIYFPPVFSQRGNSCSQASGIGYLFTYEMNLVRNLSANTLSRIYTYHYTWNFLNDGENSGSWYFDGYDLVMDNGVPSNSEMNDEVVSYTEWMTGYDKYFSAMKNRISGYRKISCDTDTGLLTIKQYLTDHGRGEAHGGLINFSAKISDAYLEYYSGPNETDISSIIRKWGTEGDHAMVFVGFDDSVRLDLNYNGQIETDEMGALIVVNSWGGTWADFGKAYMPYKLLKTPIGEGGTGNNDKYVYVIDCYSHIPTVTARLTVQHTSRNDLKIVVGVSNDPEATSPQESITKQIIRNQGGDQYMQGILTPEGKTIEVGLDLSDLVQLVPDAVRFFVTIYQSSEGNHTGKGKLIKCSILDYRLDNNNPKEYICESENINFLWKTELIIDQVVTSIPQPENDFTPSLRFYPNPVDDKMHVEYTLSGHGVIWIELLDITGKGIHTIIRANQGAGKYHYTWDRPVDLAPGIYILRFTHNRIDVNRLVIIQ